MTYMLKKHGTHICKLPMWDDVKDQALKRLSALLRKQVFLGHTPG